MPLAGIPPKQPYCPDESQLWCAKYEQQRRLAVKLKADVVDLRESVSITISRAADQKDIAIELLRYAKRQASLTYHPDRSGGSNEMQTRINAAVDWLKGLIKTSHR